MAAGPRAGEAGREHVARGSVSGLTSVDGGVRASVAETRGGRRQVFVGSTDLDFCLDAPDSYADLLGAEGLRAYDAALHR